MHRRAPRRPRCQAGTIPLSSRYRSDGPRWAVAGRAARVFVSAPVAAERCAGAAEDDGSTVTCGLVVDAVRGPAMVTAEGPVAPPDGAVEPSGG